MISILIDFTHDFSSSWFSQFIPIGYSSFIHWFDAFRHVVFWLWLHRYDCLVYTHKIIIKLDWVSLIIISQMFGFKCASDIYGHQIRGKAKLTSARMLCEKVISVFFSFLNWLNRRNYWKFLFLIFVSLAQQHQQHHTINKHKFQ